MSQNIVPKDEFRDHIGTVNLDGKRNWIYPIKPKGKYYNARNLLTVFYLIVLFGIPFIKMDGHWHISGNHGHSICRDQIEFKKINLMIKLT